jgi:hypothetical protein
MWLGATSLSATWLGVVTGSKLVEGIHPGKDFQRRLQPVRAPHSRLHRAILVLVGVSEYQPSRSRDANATQQQSQNVRRRREPVHDVGKRTLCKGSTSRCEVEFGIVRGRRTGE